MYDTDVLVGSSISSYRCWSESQSWEEYSIPGIPVFQGHLQLAASESWCTTHTGWTGCCTLTSLFLDTSPRYGTAVWLLVSSIISIFIMISSRTIVGVPPPRQVWVFGICDTSHTPARGVMRIVPDRSAATLLPIIQQHVRSGTIVHSDEWAAYNHVQHLPSVGQHRVVNHSLHFVDLATSVHTQHAKSYWTGLRQSLSEWRMSMRPCYPRICTSSCGGNVMEVPLPLLWQFCVGTVTK